MSHRLLLSDLELNEHRTSPCVVITVQYQRFHSVHGEIPDLEIIREGEDEQDDIFEQAKHLVKLWSNSLD